MTVIKQYHFILALTAMTNFFGSESRHHYQTHVAESNKHKRLLNVVKIGAYLIVKVFTHGIRYHHFIGVITYGPDEDEGFKVKYAKRFQKITAAFWFPEVEDLASVKGSDIVYVLFPPRPFAATKRLTIIFEFSNIMDYKRACTHYQTFHFIISCKKIPYLYTLYYIEEVYIQEGVIEKKGRIS